MCWRRGGREGRKRGVGGGGREGNREKVCALRKATQHYCGSSVPFKMVSMHSEKPSISEVSQHCHSGSYLPTYLPTYLYAVRTDWPAAAWLEQTGPSVPCWWPARRTCPAWPAPHSGDLQHISAFRQTQFGQQLQPYFLKKMQHTSTFKQTQCGQQLLQPYFLNTSTFKQTQKMQHTSTFKQTQCGQQLLQPYFWKKMQHTSTMDKHSFGKNFLMSTISILTYLLPPPPPPRPPHLPFTNQEDTPLNCLAPTWEHP